MKITWEEFVKLIERINANENSETFVDTGEPDYGVYVEGDILKTHFEQATKEANDERDTQP